MSQTQSDILRCLILSPLLQVPELNRLNETPDSKRPEAGAQNQQRPGSWDEPLIARSTGILPEDLDNRILPTIWSCRNDFRKSLGWAERQKH